MSLTLTKLFEALAEWGIPLAKAPTSGPSKALKLNLEQTANASTLHVGTLTVQPSKFSFSYSREFKTTDLPPIPSFPDLEKCYESGTPFPFFQVRLPPTDRTDLAHYLASKKIDSDDVFEMLRVLG